MNNFKVVQFEDFFLVIGTEVRTFQGEVKDYIYSTDEEYFNCDYLTHKVNKTLSGLIR
jgi:hypothetical protein